MQPWEGLCLAGCKELGRLLLHIMAYPIVTPVHWAVGRYDSYTLYPDGSLVGTIHPPGCVYQVNGNPNLSAMDNLLFLSSRNQICAGAWFVCAPLPRPYKYMMSERNFLCELIFAHGCEVIHVFIARPSNTHLFLLCSKRPITNCYYRSL